MKKMLVIEEPESCETCPLRSYSDLMLVCTPMREAASDVECPLKPLPQKQIPRVRWTPFDDVGYDRGFIDGYNACIEELEK